MQEIKFKRINEAQIKLLTLSTWTWQ